MESNQTKETLKNYLENTKSEFPPSFLSLIQMIEQSKTAKDLIPKFPELKKQVKQIKEKNLFYPISIEIEYASFIGIYFHKTDSNIDNIEKFKKEIKDILRFEYKIETEFEICKNGILFENSQPLSKLQWQEGIISIIRTILKYQFNTEIEYIAYA